MITPRPDARPVLRALLSGDLLLEDAERQVYQSSWDPLGDPVLVPDSAVLELLDRFVSGSWPASSVCRWANLFESREDVEWESDRTMDIVFQLANPELTGDLTVQRARELTVLLARPTDL